MSSHENDNPAAQERQCKNNHTMGIFFLAFMAVLTGAVAWIQILQSEKFALQSQRQQTRRMYIPAKRGNICDRNGLRLNYTVPMYTLVIRPDLIRDPRDTKRATFNKIYSAISDLALWLGPEFYHYKPGREEINRHLVRRTPMPIPLWEDLDGYTIARWNAKKQDFPGTELLLSWKRMYEAPQIASQIRGFTRLGNPEDFDSREYWNANFKEPVGKSGLEYLLNTTLKGSGGSELLQTDVLAYRKTLLESHKATNGEDVRLTIDLDFQQFAEQRFAEKDYAGSLVVMDATNGEVLVLASCPGYDLSQISDSYTRQEQFNRAIGGTYPPGSIIKPFLALYALENGLISSAQPCFCPGWYSLPTGRQIRCHLHSGHGNIAFVEAIAHSCNTYFCSLGETMGAKHWNEFAGIFPFGEKMDTILYKQESAGIAFSPDWCRQARPKAPAWAVNDSAYAGIGQGQWLVTPLQMAVAVTMLLTGNRFQPKLLLNESTQVLETVPWKEENLSLVKQGMRQCVIAGTGRSLQIPGVEVLGKTGTAEVANQRSHAWSVAALPANAPRYVGVAVIEHGGSGGRIAAPVLRDVLKYIYNNQKNE